MSSSSSSTSSSSTILSSRHPSDLRPLGDALVSGSKNILRYTGLGSSFRTWGDDFLLSFLSSYCTASDCAKLSTVSKAFYAFTTADDLWRNFTLAEYGTQWKYQHSWRETYARSSVLLRPPSSTITTLTEKYPTPVVVPVSSFLSITNASLQLPLFRPISVKGFYSDILFRTWYVSQASISSKWLQFDNLPRLPVSSTNDQFDTFIQLYDEPGIPVILTNVANHWPSHTKWSWSNLRQQYGLSTHFHAAGFDFPFGDYLDYMKVHDDQPLIIFDKYFADKSDLSKDYTVPPHFANDLFTLLDDKSHSLPTVPTDTTTLSSSSSSSSSSASSSCSSLSTAHSTASTSMGRTNTSSSVASTANPHPQHRPDYRWLIIGPQRSGSVFHQDPNGTSAFNACIRGTKKWFLFPPHIIPPGVYPSEDGSTVATTMSVMEWFIDFYEAARKIREKYTPLATPSTKKRTRRYGSSTDTDDDEKLSMDEELTSSQRNQRIRTISGTGGGASVNTTLANNVGYRKSVPSSAARSQSSTTTLATVTATSKDPRQVPMEGLVKEGEIIFVPRGWWHIVLNVEDTIAITQNFCSPSGLADVLQFCLTKPESISGFPTDKDRQTFYPRLYKVLKEHCPDTLAKAEKKLSIPTDPSAKVSLSSTDPSLTPSSSENFSKILPPPSFSFGFTFDDEDDEK